MIVDDHPIWRDGTARYLAEAGYEVAATAGDGAQAVRIVAAARPDVVLLDLNLPDQPGAEVTRQLLATHPPGWPGCCWASTGGCPGPTRTP
jgi:DNA-binding NarL/FixJ family response regulator